MDMPKTKLLDNGVHVCPVAEEWESHVQTAEEAKSKIDDIQRFVIEIKKDTEHLARLDDIVSVLKGLSKAYIDTVRVFVIAMAILLVVAIMKDQIKKLALPGIIEIANGMSLGKLK